MSIQPQRRASAMTQQQFQGAEEYLDRLAALEPFSPQEVVAWLGIPLDEFPAWACAHLESELASINKLARTFRDNEEPAALVRQIDDRIAELKRRYQNHSCCAPTR
jgi:hypothetical protein